jgi:hypothetical protein
MAEKTSETYTVELNSDDLLKLSELAGRRGIDANTVLKQAIATEKLISDNVNKGDKLLIRKADDSYKEIIMG